MQKPCESKERIPGSGPRIAIIGAGLGGLTAAIALKRKYGYKNFQIFDKAAEIGGTWRDNVYPGAASDVPIHLYTLSTDLDPSFKYSHGTSAEIKTYWARLCTKYNLWPHITFNSKIVSTTWSKDTNSYIIITIDPRTNAKVSRDYLNEESEGERKTYYADFIICAFGLLEIPHWPEIEGLDTFKGQMFHSARWDWSIDLSGKRVGIIGNGSTTSQFVPIITKDPSTQVTQFVRTPSWYRVDGELNWFLLRVKFLNRIFTRAGFLKDMRRIAPKQYHDKMVPDYGEFMPFDVIISATGYATNTFPIPLRGLTNRTVEEYYDLHDGAQAYHGTMLPGYPNLCMVSGPNTVTGHNSVIFSTEVQVEYIMKLIRPIMEGKIAYLDVKDEATEAYNKTVAHWLKDSIYNQCVSWYRVKGSSTKNFPAGDTDDAKEGAGKANLFPGPLVVMWWWMRKPRWDEYDVYGEGAEAWKRRVLLKERVKNAILWLTLAGGAGVGLAQALRLLHGWERLDRILPF